MAGRKSFLVIVFFVVIFDAFLLFAAFNGYTGSNKVDSKDNTLTLHDDDSTTEENFSVEKNQ